ncbi:MAG: nucleotidyltransferase domain-containing protein [archaeon]
MDIIKFLKENENSRKIFGKSELKIIEKQVLGINLNQSEKNRLSRDIREKFKFIKDVNRFSDEFSLKKGSRIREFIQEVVEVIKTHKDFRKIKKIVLFGSVVENKITFRSDIDIAVEFDEIDKKDAGKFRIYVLGRVNNRADIQVYNVLPKKIRYEIDKKGKILYEK